MALDHITIYGGTLAALLYSVEDVGKECEGLLYGKVSNRTKQEFQDDAEMLTVETVDATITNFLCGARTCTFYDGAGTLDQSTFGRLASQGQGEDDVLGWFIYRPGTNLLPSMRETAVTSAIQDFLSRSRIGCTTPSLLFIISCQKEHHGATRNYQHCVFQFVQRPKQVPKLKPVMLKVKSMGRGLSHASYQDFEPMFDMGAFQPATSAAALNSSAQLAVEQTKVVESYYEDLLKQLQNLSRQVCEGHNKLEQLRQENHQLLLSRKKH